MKTNKARLEASPPANPFEQGSAALAPPTPVQFLFEATKVEKERCTLAAIVQLYSQYASPGDPEAARALGGYLNIRRHNTVVTNAAVRALTYLGGPAAHHELQTFHAEVDCRRDKLGAEIDDLRERKAGVPVRHLREFGYLSRTSKMLDKARSEVVHRTEPADGYALIIERLFAAGDKDAPLGWHKRLSNRARRPIVRGRSTAVDRQLLAIANLLNPEEHREALELLVSRCGARCAGTVALDKLSPVLDDESFVALVRNRWLSKGLRSWERHRLRAMLERRGEAGSRLICEAYQNSTKASVRSLLLSSVIRHLPEGERFAAIVSVLNDRKAAPKEREEALRELRELRNSEAAKIFLEIVCDPQSPKAQASLASDALRALGTSVYFRVLVEEHGLEKAARTATNRKVCRRLALLRRQIENIEMADAGWEKRERGTSGVKRSSVLSPAPPIIQTATHDRPLFMATGTRHVRPTQSSPPRWRPPQGGPKILIWKGMEENRRRVSSDIVHSPTSCGALGHARKYGMGAIRLIPPEYERGDPDVVMRALERLLNGGGKITDRIRTAVVAGFVAEKIRLGCGEEVIAWN